MNRVDQIYDWLVDGGPGAAGPAEIVQTMCDSLLAAGIPIDRCAAFVRTLHPHIMGRAFNWSPGATVVVREAPYAALREPTFLRSVVAAVYETRAPIRRRLVDPSTPRDYLPLDELAAEGVTDYLAVPMIFMSGDVHVISFATKAPEGFSDAHVDALGRISRPLSRIAEILALRRTAANLISTYVGRDAGERVLSGKIQRGDTDMIRAVIWFSDLRGFTTLASGIAPHDLIKVLNDVFDCQVPAIERNGGEVLKFIGDGLLAIFPIEGTAKTLTETCDAALAAAKGALEDLATLNASRAKSGHEPIRFGLALHIGEVAYGNIGGNNRLDFTCIGPAVNIASRLEGLTGKVGRPVVVSEDVARASTRPTERLGDFELKGVPQAQAVYAPTEGLLSSW